MVTLDELYTQSQREAIDIVEHLPTLTRYGAECSSILELGVRDGHSTVAFLLAVPEKMVSIDIEPRPRVTTIKQTIPGWQFIQKSSTEYDSSQGFDLLFIDTCHQYELCLKELVFHAPNIKKFILLHDTVSFARVDEFTGAKGGVMTAIEEFLAANPEWKIRNHYENNNGLMVLERCINPIIGVTPGDVPGLSPEAQAEMEAMQHES